MARYQSNTTDQFKTVQRVTDQAVAVGDLVVAKESGFVGVLNTVLGVGYENNNTAGVTAVLADVQLKGSNYGASTSGDQLSKSICELGNGNIVYAFSGNGTSDASRNANFHIRTPVGGEVIAEVVFSTGSGTVICQPRVRKIDSIKFVISWVSTSNTLKFAIYNNDGTVVKAETTVATLNNNTSNGWNMNVLTNGGVVFAYDKVTSRDAAVSIFNSSGTQVGTEITVESAAQPTNFCVIPCSNGDFVVYYTRAATTQNYKFARYNSTGTIQGALTTVGGYNNTWGGGYRENLGVELTNGNIAVMNCNTTGNYNYIFVYNPSNTLQFTTTVTRDANNYNYIPQMIPETGGGFSVHYASTDGKNKLNIFDSVGGGIITDLTTHTLPISATSNEYARSTYSLGAAGYTIVSYQNAGGTLALSISRISTQGVQVGTTTTIFNTTLKYLGGDIMLSSGIVTYLYNDNSTALKTGNYATSRKGILGVALTAAASGGTCKVGTKGTFQINQNVSAGGTFDATGYTTPGTKGTVMGTTAILNGVA